MKHALLILATVLVGTSLYGQSSQYKRKSKAKTKSSKKSDKVDVTDLSKKYWKPKDTEFNVVQNRAYTKAKKIAISGLLGPVINDGYSTGLDVGFTANYFINERYGIEFSYIASNLADNDVVEAFLSDPKNTNGIYPDHGKAQNYIGVGFNYIPMYAKASLLNKHIVYFDLAFTPTLGVVSYDQIRDPKKGSSVGKSAVAVGLDISQYYFLSKTIAVRADIKNKWYSEDVMSADTGLPLRTKQTNMSTIMVGLTYYFQGEPKWLSNLFD